MRIRALTASGDYSFGQGGRNFLVDTPATVAQAVQTNLLLHAGEWYLDLLSGMPWETQVLGKYTNSLYDNAVKSQILSTEGVTQIVSYNSFLDANARTLTIGQGAGGLQTPTLISTIYSTQPVPIGVVIPVGGYGVFPYGTMGYGI